MYLLWVLIGSFCCLHMLWLAIVIASIGFTTLDWKPLVVLFIYVTSLTIKKTFSPFSYKIYSYPWFYHRVDSFYALLWVVFHLFVINMSKLYWLCCSNFQVSIKFLLLFLPLSILKFEILPSFCMRYFVTKLLSNMTHPRLSWHDNFWNTRECWRCFIMDNRLFECSLRTQTYFQLEFLCLEPEIRLFAAA